MTDLTNQQLSTQEVSDLRASKPDRYFAYAGRIECGQALTTWMGDKIGRILSANDVYRSNFGDRRQSFRAMLINGEVYSGVAYLDAGDYVRLRKVKGDMREVQQATTYAEVTAR